MSVPPSSLDDKGRIIQLAQPGGEQDTQKAPAHFSLRMPRWHQAHCGGWDMNQRPLVAFALAGLSVLSAKSLKEAKPPLTTPFHLFHTFPTPSSSKVKFKAHLTHRAHPDHLVRSFPPLKAAHLIIQIIHLALARGF